MFDFLAVMISIMGLGLVAWFVYRNDQPGNVRPDKTLLAMREDPPPEKRGWSR